MSQSVRLRPLLEVWLAGPQQLTTRRPVAPFLDMPQLAAVGAAKEVDVRREQDVIECDHMLSAAFWTMRSC
jgi:hypothetical protein